MLQTICLLALLFEALILGAIAYGLQRQGFTWPTAIAFCFCLAVMWRLGICLLHALIAGAMRRAVGKALPLGNSIKAFVVETRAKMLSMSVLQPFHQLVLGAEPKNAPTGVAPIVLVHGYVSNRGIWYWFRKNLQRALPDAVIYAVTLEPVFVSIDTCAAQLGSHLKRIQALHPNQPLTLVAHSMGGLMIRAYLRDCAGTANATASGSNLVKIRKIFCLGSPHEGARFAQIGHGVCAKQMRCNSPWLKALAAFEISHPPTVPIVCIYTLNDDIAYPAESGALQLQSPAARVENIAVSAVGHVSLLFSPDVLALVLKRLER